MKATNKAEAPLSAFHVELSTRLRELEKRFVNRDAAANAAGVAKSTFQRWVEGKSDPSFEGLARLANHTGMSLDWLAGGTVAPANSAEIKGKPPRSMVAIPILEVAASAGHGAVALREQPSDFLWFNEAWLRQTYGVNPNELKLLASRGESMAPTIAPGSILMVNCGDDARKAGDGIYVVRLEGDILVKRLQRLPGNLIKVSSDNPAYEPFTVRLDDGVDFEMLGRVVVAIDLKRL